jgi:hypothetical protein
MRSELCWNRVEPGYLTLGRTSSKRNITAKGSESTPRTPRTERWPGWRERERKRQQFPHHVSKKRSARNDPLTFSPTGIVQKSSQEKSSQVYERRFLSDGPKVSRRVRSACRIGSEVRPVCVPAPPVFLNQNCSRNHHHARSGTNSVQTSTQSKVRATKATYLLAQRPYRARSC